ncbi:MAG: response regulator [Candidatus Omnitrophica bacterium]|nr:response regulator [Candidatus Omnitrophota bacterium]
MATILIVDDEKLICEEFRDILIEENHEVDIALGGEEALEKIKEKAYDLIFLDVLMPKMEGREVFERIKAIRNTPVAIMSGYMPPNKEREVLGLGAIACLRKPLELERVKSLVRSIESKKSPE